MTQGQTDIRKKSAVSLKDILPGVIQGISCQNIPDHVSLEKIWSDLVLGDADRAIVAGVKDGTLFVTCDCTARLFKMRMQKQTLLTKIQRQRTDIQNIVFKIGNVK